MSFRTRLVFKNCFIFCTRFLVLSYFLILTLFGIFSQAVAKAVLQELIGLSFKMADVVSPVVNNSSPEGHLPMDFQNISGNDDGKNN